MSVETQRVPLMAAKLVDAVAEALQPPIKATEQELRVAQAICEADSHVWPDDSYNGRAQIRAFLKLARAALAVALVAELKTENARLREALQAMLDFPGGMYAPALEAKARAALKTHALIEEGGSDVG